MSQSLSDKKDKILVKNNAKTIYDHLKELKNTPIHHEKRWFWELLQNAKDSKSENTRVNITLTINDSEVIFSHDGKAFTEDDIIHIIFHGSTKDQLEGKTGKFGTGFMTTHLLAMQVGIKGKLEYGSSFEFLLNREAKNADELKEKLDESYRQFEDCLNDKISTTETVVSKFSYKVDKDHLALARAGVEEIKKIASYVLAFNNNSIGSITIIDRGCKWSTKISQVADKDSPISISKLEVSDGTVEEILIYKVNDTDMIAIPIKGKQLLPVHNDTPKLFLDFPLFGTEEFGIPFIINSSEFTPQKERTGIYIKGGSEDSINNQKIITDILKTVSSIIEYCKKNDYTNIVSLLNFSKTSKYDWNDPEYVYPLFSDLLNNFFQIPIIKTVSGGDIISIEQSRIPICSNTEHSKKLYFLSQSVIAHLLPEQQQFDYIIDYRENWKIINNDKFSNLSFNWGIKDLLDEIDQRNETQYWIDEVFSNDENAFYDWINEILILTKKENKTELLRSYKCIPNQDGQMVTLDKDKIFVDRIVLESGAEDIQLKDLATKIGCNIRAELLHTKISEDIHSLFSSYGHTSLHTEVVEILNEKKEQYVSSHDPSSNPLLLYWNWCFEVEKPELLKKVPIMMGINDPEEATTETHLLSTDTQILLPPSKWPDRLQPYSKLLSPKVIIHELYAQSLGEERVTILMNTYPQILKSPMYEDEELLKKEDLLNLVTDKDKHILQSDSIELKIQKTTVNKLFGFATTDSSVLSKTRESKKKTKELIEFLLKDLIYADNSWKEIVECVISDEKTVNIIKSQWLSKLKTNAWVALSTSINDNINADNISQYIKELRLNEELNKPEVTQFLHALKLPVTDIIRNVFLADVEKRQEYDSLYAQMLQANQPAEDIKGILEDNEIFELYRQKRKNSESVRKNKKIGDLFEETLKNIFASQEYKDLGFEIKREPVGSDYIIGTTADIVPEEDCVDENEVFIIRQGIKQPYYLELKATSRDMVSMTRTQANIAHKNPKNYSLVVFSYNEEADITTENVKNSCLFTTDIGERLAIPFTNQDKVQHTVELHRAPADIYIDSNYGDIRFRIRESVWSQGKMLRVFAEEFIQSRDANTQL